MIAITDKNLKDGETSLIHRFEHAGLGKAPFRFTGTVTEKVFCVPGEMPKAGSSCDYCGGYLVILHEMPRIEFHIDTDSCDNAHKIAVALVEKERGKMRLTGATIQKR